jgi:N-acetylglucosamine-6-phosphate deacetylase
VPLLEAVTACTLRPARLLGIERERGTLRPGARADLVFLDSAGCVAETWIDGECLHAVA